MEKALPSIPAKRYFTIGEVSELCAVKPYVLRYWEQEFTQLKPMKRRGNRRYYQHHEVLLIRRIRELLYDHGFTISGARNRLADGMPSRLFDADAAGSAPEARSDQAGADAADSDDAVVPLSAGVLSIPERAIAASAGSMGRAAAAVAASSSTSVAAVSLSSAEGTGWAVDQLRAELMSIRDMLAT
jgi:DNA-binding transcriptional MerR regulator